MKNTYKFAFGIQKADKTGKLAIQSKYETQDKKFLRGTEISIKFPFSKRMMAKVQDSNLEMTLQR